jgi:hypothetical protein
LIDWALSTQVFDQFLAFSAVEPQMFSLCHRDSYLTLNDPTLRDTAVEAAVAHVVEGIYAALVTLAIVPIIRCPKVHHNQSVDEIPPHVCCSRSPGGLAICNPTALKPYTLNPGNLSRDSLSR